MQPDPVVPHLVKVPFDPSHIRSDRSEVLPRLAVADVAGADDLADLPRYEQLLELERQVVRPERDVQVPDGQQEHCEHTDELLGRHNGREWERTHLEAVGEIASRELLTPAVGSFKKPSRARPLTTSWVHPDVDQEMFSGRLWAQLGADDVRLDTISSKKEGSSDVERARHLQPNSQRLLGGAGYDGTARPQDSRYGTTMRFSRAWSQNDPARSQSTVPLLLRPDTAGAAGAHHPGPAEAPSLPHPCPKHGQRRLSV